MFSKESANRKDIQKALKDFYPKEKWVVRGNKAYNKGCTIYDRERRITIASFRKNWDAVNTITDPKIDLKKKIHQGLGIVLPENLAKQLEKDKNKLRSLLLEVYQYSGGKLKAVWKGGEITEIKLIGIDKTIE